MKTRIVLIYDDLSTDKLDPLKRLFPDFFEEPTIRQTPLETAGDFLKESGEFTFCFFQQGINKDRIIQLIHNPNTEIVEGVLEEDTEVIKLFGLGVDKKKSSK